MLRIFSSLLLALCVAIPELAAQTARPGGAARGSTTRSTTATRGGATSGSRSSAGGARQYRSNTELGDAIIQIDPETRSLVILTDDETHEELMKVIKTLDQPKPQVLIKVVFVEVTYNNATDIGVEGSYTFNLGSAIPATTGSRTTTGTATSDTGSAVNPGTSTTTSTLTTPLDVAASLASTVNAGSNFGLAGLTNGTFVRVVNDDWSATLRALQTKGKVEVVSRPSIMARNNQEAVIVVGQEVPFVTNSRVTDNGQTINTITYDNVGIILRVTPFITSEGTVEMIVAPEISALTDQTVAISDTASAPVISKRSAETVVVTPDAQTVVIGGLMQTQKIESVQKVPILGDIPVLGFPFRRTVKNDVKTELLIFLTPYIVNNPAQGAHVTNREIDEAELMQEAFTPREIDRYLDLPQFRTSEVQTTVVTGAKTMADPEPVKVTRTSRSTTARSAPAAAVPVRKATRVTPEPRRQRTIPKGLIR